MDSVLCVIIHIIQEVQWRPLCIRKIKDPVLHMPTSLFPTGIKKGNNPELRTLIGRVDDQTGEIVPTDGRNRRNKEKPRTLNPVLFRLLKLQDSFMGQHISWMLLRTVRCC